MRRRPLTSEGLQNLPREQPQTAAEECPSEEEGGRKLVPISLIKGMLANGEKLQVLLRNITLTKKQQTAPSTCSVVMRCFTPGKC